MEVLNNSVPACTGLHAVGGGAVEESSFSPVIFYQVSKTPTLPLVPPYSLHRAYQR